MTIITIEDTTEFENLLNTTFNRLLVIDFGASWCGPCKRIEPLIQDLSESMLDITFCKVDIDEVEELVEKFNITSVPTFIFIKNNNLLDRVEGVKYDNILELCNKHS